METFYRINRLAMYLAMLLYVPLTLAMVAVLGLVLYLLGAWVMDWVGSGRITPRTFAVVCLAIIFVSLSAAGVAFALLAGLFRLFIRFRSEPVFGVLLQPAQNKPFFDLLDRVCTKLKVRPPEQCYLSPFSEMSIGERTVTDEDGRVRRNVRTLVVGAGLLVHIRIDELTTFLAHEMAHAKAGDTRFGWWAMRFAVALASAIAEQEQEESESSSSTILNTAVRVGLTAYFRLFALMYSADERWRELQADRMAARLCGPQNLRNGLIKIHLAGYIPDLSIESLLVEYSQNERDVSDLYDEYRRRWEQLPAERIEKAENQMFLDRHSWYDSHPCLAVRIRWLRGIEAKEITGAKPATRLFTDWPRLASMMTAALIGRGRYLHRAYIAQVLGGR